MLHFHCVKVSLEPALLRDNFSRLQTSIEGSCRGSETLRVAAEIERRRWLIAGASIAALLGEHQVLPNDYRRGKIRCASQRASHAII